MGLLGLRRRRKSTASAPPAPPTTIDDSGVIPTGLYVLGDTGSRFPRKQKRAETAPSSPSTLDPAVLPSPIPRRNLGRERPFFATLSAVIHPNATRSIPVYYTNHHLQQPQDSEGNEDSSNQRSPFPERKSSNESSPSSSTDGSRSQSGPRSPKRSASTPTRLAPAPSPLRNAAYTSPVSPPVIARTLSPEPIHTSPVARSPSPQLPVPLLGSVRSRSRSPTRPAQASPPPPQRVVSPPTTSAPISALARARSDANLRPQRPRIDPSVVPPFQAASPQSAVTPLNIRKQPMANSPSSMRQSPVQRVPSSSRPSPLQSSSSGRHRTERTTRPQAYTSAAPSPPSSSPPPYQRMPLQPVQNPIRRDPSPVSPHDAFEFDKPSKPPRPVVESNNIADATNTIGSAFLTGGDSDDSSDDSHVMADDEARMGRAVGRGRGPARGGRIISPIIGGVRPSPRPSPNSASASPNGGTRTLPIPSPVTPSMNVPGLRGRAKSVAPPPGAGSRQQERNASTPRLVVRI